VTRANEAPFSEGLFVIGMLITTLAPTFVHITRGLAGITAAWTPGAAEAAAGLRENWANSGQHDVTEEGAAEAQTGDSYYWQTDGYARGGVRDGAVMDYGAPAEPETAAEIRPSVRQNAARALRLSRLWYVPSAAVALGLFVALAALLDASGVALGDFLVKLAFCASSWSHGACPI
jgi:hypothetical protein